MSEENIQIMVIDDEEIVGKRLKTALEKSDYDVEIFKDSREAVNRIAEKEFDVVVTDVRMDGIGGMTVLEHAFEKSARTKVIVITGYATVEVALGTREGSSVRGGALGGLHDGALADAASEAFKARTIPSASVALFSKAETR